MSIVLLPGFYGSVLVKKGKQTRTWLKKDIYHNRSFFKFEQPFETWKQDIEVHYHNKHFKYSDNLEVLPGLQGIQNLFPELAGFEITGQKYFGTLIGRLEEEGFQEGVNLAGMPYDYRIILEPEILETYMTELADTIEQLDGKTTILAHSIGGLLAIYFLNRFVSKQWKKKNIASLVTVNSPFSGVPTACDVLISGYNEIPGLQQCYGDLMKHYAGFALCLPNRLAYHQTTPVFAFERQGERFYEGYSIQDFPLLSAVTNSQTYEIWHDLGRHVIRSFLDPTEVPTWCFVDLQKPTPKQFYYQDIASRNSPYHKTHTRGDGLVPEESLLWGHRQHGYKVIEIPNVGHSRILDDERLVRFLLKSKLRGASSGEGNT